MNQVKTFFLANYKQKSSFEEQKFKSFGTQQVPKIADSSAGAVAEPTVDRTEPARHKALTPVPRTAC